MVIKTEMLSGTLSAAVGLKANKVTQVIEQYFQIEVRLSVEEMITRQYLTIASIIAGIRRC